MHPAEASHGDLGMITAQDVVVAISYSGESDEIMKFLPIIKRRGAKVIAITGRTQSTLAVEADVHLDAGVTKEACPLNLAPTASTTATLALGDALAVALLDARGFKSDDFAMHHPGGALGRRLLVHVADIMRKGAQLPRSSRDTLLPEAIIEMSQKGIGMTAVVDADDRLLGIFTDGDLRRTLEKHDNIRNVRVGDVMKTNPRAIAPERLAAEAAQMLQEHKLGGRLVVLSPDGKLIGALTFHDLLAAGVV
jgi:arabinose-5-phosphate isomerase